MIAFALWASLFGCGTKEAADSGCEDCGIQIGGEPGDVQGECEPFVTLTTAAMSDLVVGGHSGDEAMKLLAGPRVYAPVWWDGRQATLTLTGDATGATVQVHDYPGGPEDCPRRLDFDATVHLVSEDGAVDESWIQRVYWSRPWDNLDLVLAVPVGELNGTLDTAAIKPDAKDLVGDLVIGGDWGDLGFLMLTGPEENPGSTAAVNVRFAEWGLQGTEGGDSGE